MAMLSPCARASESIHTTVVDTHYCGGVFCVLWWGFLRTVVDKQYRRKITKGPSQQDNETDI